MNYEKTSQQDYEQNQLSNKQKIKPKVFRSVKKTRIPPDIDTPPQYLPLKTLNDRYHLISTLGNGSFGSVSLAKSAFSFHEASNFKTISGTLIERAPNYDNENAANKRSKLVAIKSINEKLPTLNDYTRVKEIRFILSIPYHVNLIQVYEIFIDNSDYRLHVVMECMDLNLHQLIKVRKHNHFSLPTLRSILAQILNGIRHIHRNSYFHRDIKPENILISPTNTYYDANYIKEQGKVPDNFVVKIADYGLARHVDNRRPYTSYISTRWYRAPEILLRKDWYSRPVDIWAFGSVAAEVATFRPLFPGSDELEQTCKVLEVLGTPISKNNFEKNYIPSYGYWDEAVFLSSKLGLRFPMNRCIDMGQIIPGPELAPLCDVIRSCLLWNPNERLDAEKIARMPYFRGTCVDDYDIPPGTSPNITFSSSVKENINSQSEYLEKSSKLAGITNRKLSQISSQNQTKVPVSFPLTDVPRKSVLKKEKNMEIGQTQTMNTLNMLSEYLEESDDSMDCGRVLTGIQYEKDCLERMDTGNTFFNDDFNQIPELTRDGPNDQSYKSANQELNVKPKQYLDNKWVYHRPLPVMNTPLLHSCDQSYDTGSLDKNSVGYESMDLFTHGTLKNYTGFHSYDESNIRNTEDLGNNKSFLNYQSSSKKPGNLNEAELHYLRLGNRNGLTRDSTKALNERYYSLDVTSSENNNDSSFRTERFREPIFTKELYSKFNIHTQDVDKSNSSLIFDHSITPESTKTFDVY